MTQDGIAQKLWKLPFPAKQRADLGVVYTDRILFSDDKMDILCLCCTDSRPILERSELDQEKDTQVLDQPDREDVRGQIVWQFL